MTDIPQNKVRQTSSSGDVSKTAGAEQGNDGRSQNEFWSVDSMPAKFAGHVPVSRAPYLLAVFCIITLTLLILFNQAQTLNAAFPDDDLIFGPYAGTHSIPMRLFILSFFISFALFCDRSWAKIFGVMADMCLTYILICAVMDTLGIVTDSFWEIQFPLHLIEICSGLVGFAVFSFKLIERGHMPAPIKMEIATRDTLRTSLKLIAVACVSAVISIGVGMADLDFVRGLRDFALLGGIGPGVFLFLPVLFLLLYAIARVEHLLAKSEDFAPPLTFIVPAHNEEYIIANTIEAMDAAAANYGGKFNILIMNNNSEDKTGEIAAQKLSECKYATGRVIDVPTPGKAHALNAGLEVVDTEFFVRVDADTLVDPMSIHRAMRQFVDKKVGVVGGMPVPPGGAMFDHARLLEVIVKHGFYSVGMGAINSVVGIPGMLAIYRTKLPKKLGGFVAGMNGEDTDISLRIGELGYKLIVDPKVRYVSEVPASYHHLREQRLRWFRSVYHVSSRCRELLYSKHLTVRGKIILPYMLINSARRAMMVPLLLFGIIECATQFNAYNTMTWQAVLAVGIGAPAIIAVIASLINGSLFGILCVPEYLAFRLLRAYFTLESMLSISIKSYGEHAFSASALARPRPKSITVA